MPEPSQELDSAAVDRDALAAHARQTAKSCAWLSGHGRTGRSGEIYRKSLRRLKSLERKLYTLRSGEPSEDLRWIYDSLRLVHAELHDLSESIRGLGKLPAVHTATEDAIPRCVVLARGLLVASECRLTQAKVSSYLEAVQEIDPLRLAEIDGFLMCLKLGLLESLAKRGWQALEAFRKNGKDAASFEVGPVITALRFIGEEDWRETLEKLSIVHRTLSLDPAGVYSRMETETRGTYRGRVAAIARHSDVGEIEIARLAVDFAQSAIIDPAAPEALRNRLRHVGYYLLDGIGSRDFLRRVGYRPALNSLLPRLFRGYPDEVYIIGIEFVTLITVVLILMSLVTHHNGLALIVSALILLLPATQAAVEVVNYLVTTVLTARPLPKIDVSKGVDPLSATIVAIPTLLINDKQIRQLIDDLEIRYLVNRDANIYYALLTDLPDTAEPVGDTDARIDLAIQLIDALNDKYSGLPYGGFYLFHRHRIFNPREGAWMGWERKRGKLLDLNQYLRDTFDPFPVKAGPLDRLPRESIRYVITLDSDSQLPRSTAQRLIGAMAHPLNRPLIDPDRNIVTRGYGILQPRVGVSVHTAATSRLARIYSGQTGFDIYSRAASDVYQDLYGEGIFTGKGIYDIDALRAVLERRFPRNALLSHDLIEGAYARAGLASDIEVIDDYPSHYSAYNRRKHRWLRGDWQIFRWIFNKVPDETRRLVTNPISLVSRWKIADNLRRSLMEPATFLLFVTGWFLLPGGPRFWTIVSLALLFLPVYFRLLFALTRACLALNLQSMREAFEDFITSHAAILLNIAFLAHQTLVSVDAIIRTVVRTHLTHRSLLEWETATEAELGIRKRTPVDIYLDWLPLLAGALACALILRPEAAPYAAPFLIAWGGCKLLSKWLNRSPRKDAFELSQRGHRLLRETALRTWKYFSTFSTEANHWLIPDNVQEEPYRVAERISPTNLGLLLNARQAALEFGYLTFAEFVSLTEKTLAGIAKLPRFHGHFVNWYDTTTLQPLVPRVISSVDNGNFVASLWSLRQGCIELLERPVILPSALEGLADYAQSEPLDDSWRRLFRLKEPLEWLPLLLSQNSTGSKAFDERLQAIKSAILNLLPWYSPEYEPLFANEPFPKTLPTAASAEAFYSDLSAQVGRVASESDLARQLSTALADAHSQLERLAATLRSISSQCNQLSEEMDFSLMINPRRKLMSIGYDVDSEKLNDSCYDLLASEARIAAFIAVAKDEASQESWFRLGRQHTVCEGESVLISWTGTMFEYLMPLIWMRSHPDTLLARSLDSAVRAQQSYGRRRGIPWGISESAYAKTDEWGNYQYAAFGVPGLALRVARAGFLVVAPYASCLALMVDLSGSVDNLARMARKGWLGEFGFYESADYTASSSRAFRSRKYQLVRCFMAHHQGMSLTALCNVFYENPFQRWFHAATLVQASELILNERPLRVRPIADLQPRRVVNFGAPHAPPA
jgi:cyclic beta-1,2-glucan synthetase